MSGWSNQAVTLILLVEEASGFSGLFAYTPTPGKGNLQTSIAADSGDDPYDNPYFAGVEVQAPGPSTPQSVRLDVVNGIAIAIFGSGAASEAQAAQIVGGSFNQNQPDEQIALTYFGPQGTASPEDLVQLVMYGSPANAAGEAELQLNWIGGSPSTLQTEVVVGSGGLAINTCDFIYSKVPGSSGAGMSNESWHNLTLQSGFSAGSVTPQYRIEPIAGGVVRLRGGVGLTANKTAGSEIAVLPAGYVPAHTAAFNTTNDLSGYSISTGSVEIQSGTGNLVIVPAGTSGDSVFLDGITFPLD